MFNILKKIIIIIAVMLVIFFIAFLTAAWHYGAFASVEEVHLKTRDETTLVTVNYACTPYQVQDQIRQIDSLLNEKTYLTPVTAALFQTNPLNSKPDSVTVKGAVILKEPVQVDSPFVILKLPIRQAAVTSINAHPLIAPYRTYPSIQHWLANNGYQYNPAYPVIEYYSGEKVEVEMPVMTDSTQTLLPLKTE